MYRIRESSGGGLIIVDHPRHSRQLWAMGSRNGYKSHQCVICERTVAKNTEPMYRPVGNPQNRSKRICQSCEKQATD